MTGGIEKKWLAVNEERDQLREERDHLRIEVERLLAERVGARALEKYGLTLSDDEQDVMNAILFVFNMISHDWGLKTNANELAAAVHVLQMFVIQRMLGRLAPDQWSGWWEKAKTTEGQTDVESG